MKKIFLFLWAVLIVCQGCDSPPVKTRTLPNGIQVVAISMPTAPLTSLQAWFSVGARNEKKELGGTSHFLEHLLFKRGKDPAFGTLAARVEKFGGDFNAATSHDFTYFYINIPPENFRVGLESLRDALREPSFNQKDFDAEKKVVLAEMAQRKDNPWSTVYEKLYAVLFPQHPYGHKVIGEEKTVRRMTGLQIADYYRQQYRPDRLTFIMAGPRSTDEMLANAADSFKNFPKSIIQVEQTLAAPQPPLQNQWEVYSKEVSLEYFSLAWLGPPANHKDDIPLDLLAALLGEGRSSRLHQRLVEKMGLAYEIRASFDSSKDAGAFIITGTCSPKNHEKLLRQLKEEIGQLRIQAPSSQEVERIKTALEVSYLKKHETPTDFAQSIGSAVVTSNIDDDLHYLDKINSVTGEQIRDLAQKYLGISVGVSVIPK